jgi:hypothetical protein
MDPRRASTAHHLGGAHRRSPRAPQTARPGFLPRALRRALPGDLLGALAGALPGILAGALRRARPGPLPGGLALAAALVLGAAPPAPGSSPPLPVTCDLSAFQPSPELSAEAHGEEVTLRWAGTASQSVQMSLAVRNGVPTLVELAVREGTGPWIPVARDARIEYHVVEGYRRITNQQLAPLHELGVEITQEIVDRHRWDAYWDAPLDLRTELPVQNNPPPMDGLPGTDQPPLPRSPDEIRRGVIEYGATSCRVRSEEGGASVTFDGVRLGTFTGDLVLRVFRGTNLLETRVVASTDLPSVAYKYDAGLTGLLHGPESHVAYRDLAGYPRTFGMRGPANEVPVAVQAANRLLVGQVGEASVAAFPPPHVFFWARQLNANVGYNWYRKDGEDAFSIGIRQGESEVAENWLVNWALYNAPPGSTQQMRAYFFPWAGPGTDAAAQVLAFTNGDVYPRPAGYEAMGSHYHINVGQRIEAAGGNLDLHIPDFDVLRSAGLTIVGPSERPPNARQVEMMQWVFDWAERHSDESFMIHPQLERGNLLGGHWDLLYSRPTHYVALDGPRSPEQPLVLDDPDYGPVYQIGSVEDFLEMFEAEDMLVYMPHPRTKGSTGFPDAVAESPQFLHDRYRGVGWRWGMGLDLSERRLSDYRVLPLLDEMNNWIAHTDLTPKWLLAITETYYHEYGDDVYGGGPVTYLRLPGGLPPPGEYGPIVEALAAGDYFLSTGEVLIPEHRYEGSGAGMTLTATVRWTFPLDFLEVITGDGETVTTLEVPGGEHGAFGERTFVIPFDGTDQVWVRFAAWDVAGNGAMTNPVRIGDGGR